MIVADFFTYALTRDDWMASYLDHIKGERNQIKKNVRSKFRVIQGGLTGSRKDACNPFEF